ncbi:MAG: hypothetical protein JSU66_05405 [Deltaproteobacteria bacterium]|nr:MAG: hypothetical protein JSU66_05405 [Deltaproteobacteria bacterium]
MDRARPVLHCVMTPRRGALVDAALVLGGLAYLLPLRRHGLMINDDGWYLHPVLRMLDGEVLYRDVLTFYAPLEHHLFAAVFSLAEPSIVLARTVWVAILVATVVLTHRVALRLVPPGLAWLPAVVYALVPGPWHKALLGFCAMSFFLVLARFLEKPTLRRAALMGGTAGLIFVTRQDLGLAGFAIALGAAAIPQLAPARFGVGAAPSLRGASRSVATALAGFGLPVALTAAYYAHFGALPALVEMAYVRAFGQMGAHRGSLGRLLSPDTFGLAAEGRAVGILMLAPLVVYPAAGVALIARLRRHGLDATSVLLLSLLAVAVATLSQAYLPMLLIRLLQSAIPLYLLTTFVAAELARVLARRAAAGPGRLVAAAPPVLLVAAAAALVWLVIAGIPHVHPSDEYSGSARVRRAREPVEVLGDTLRVRWELAEEIRLVRAFFDACCEPDEPVLALPLHATYYILLDRRNPTRILGEHYGPGDYVLSDARKRAEMERLRASDARYAIVAADWLAWPERPERLRRTLLRNFHPVRAYRSLVILARGGDASDRRLTEVHRRLLLGREAPEDTERLRERVRERPAEPLPRALLGMVLAREGRIDASIRAFRAAALRDPSDPIHLERAARLLFAQGRFDEARRDLIRARAVRESPELRALWEKIPPAPRDATAPPSPHREDPLG